MSSAALVSRSPHFVHPLGSPFASWDSPLLSPILTGYEATICLLQALCAAVGFDLGVVATWIGSTAPRSVRLL